MKIRCCRLAPSAVDGLAQVVLEAVALQELGDEEGQLQRLVGIEPRVAMGVVAVATGPRP